MANEKKTFLFITYEIINLAFNNELSDSKENAMQGLFQSNILFFHLLINLDVVD